ncbi:MAG: hypothetical protein QOG99_1997 [Frankiales bacterium]|jgi:hypothetical protein|nr:hypothetical protein [Frankiales bacterium]
MTDWSSLLQRHVAAASPRPFEDVVRRVRRRRQRQVVGAALGVLVVVAGTALAVGRPTPSARPQPAASGSPLPGVGEPPASVVVAGKRYPLLQAVPVHVALVSDRSGRELGLKLRLIPDQDVNSCGLVMRAFLLRQDASNVRIGLYEFGRSTACFGYPESTGSRTLTVPLGAALGNRTITAAGSGKEVAVLETDTLLRATSLPSTFTRADEVVDVAPGQTDAYDTARWRSRGGSFLSLIQGISPAGTGSPFPDHVDPVVVRGHLGTATTHRLYNQTRCLRWYEGRAIALCSTGSTPISVAQLQAIAHGLTSTTSAHDSTLVPTTVYVDGSAFQLVGDQPVEVVYAGTSDDQLVIRAGRDASSAECGPITRSFVLSEDASAIRIGTYFFLASGGGGRSCGAVADSVAEQVLQLQHPLGTRKVVAVTDFNRLVPVIDERDYLSTSYLPSGYQRASFLGGRTRLALGYARQTWQVSGEVRLSLDEGSLPGEVRVLGPIVGHLTVRGHDADVVQQRGVSIPVRCLRWHESADDEVQLCSHAGGRTHVLPDGELLRVAAALHRP